MRSPYALTWRNLTQHRLRTTLSALAVALGVAMIVAASVTSSGVSSALETGENVFAEYFTDTSGIILNAIGFVILAAAGFLIFNAFAMAVTQRRRQIGALRSLGMTRRQVMQQLLVEALITGGLGTLLGLVAGPLSGYGMLAAVRRAGVEIGQGSVSVGSLVLAVVMGLGITLLSVMIPARRATRISPLVALRQEVRLEKPGFFRKTWFLGLLIAVGLAAYFTVAPPGEWSGNNPPWEWIMTLLLSLPWLGAMLLILPTLIGGAGRAVQGALTRLWGATGRLMTDNLGRDRRRVTLTVLTFAVGLTVIVMLNGMLAFMNDVLLVEAAQGSLQQVSWFIYPFDRRSGLAQVGGFDAEKMGISPEVQEDVYRLATGRAGVSAGYMAVVPEISSPMPGFPSVISGLDDLTRSGLFTFVEGDWETALPIMESGCGLLLPPSVAARNRVGIGDTMILPGKDGPVECIVAGIGYGGTAPMSRISLAAKDAFVDGPPASLTVWPLPGTDVIALETDLRALADRHGDDAWVTTPEDEVQAVIETSDQLESMAYSLLVLAVVAAALGMVNTTVMSVAERRHELGLLRAVGATRRQAHAVVAGEAALMGLIGGLVGLIAGVGLTIIFCLSFGGIPFGLVDLDLWNGAWRSVQPALLNGLIGIVIAPVVSAVAAWLPTRSILCGTAIETIQPERLQVQRTAQVRRTSLTWTMAWRNLAQHRLRTALSALAVALGAAMTVAADVTSGAIMNALSESESAQTFLTGLLDQLDSMLTLVGVGITFAAGFLVFNAFAMSVTQRRRQIGALRSLGMVRRQVMRLVLVEALITGGAGTLVGLVAGPLLGRGTIALMKAWSEGIFVFAETGASLSSLLLATVLGIGVTLLSALIPAWRATRISPLVALREEIRLLKKPGFFRKTWFLGVLVILALTAYLVVAPPGEWVTSPMDSILTSLFVLLWLGSLALILPTLIGGVGRWVRAPLTRLWGATGRLIGDNLGRGRGRVVLTILTLAVALTMIVSMTGFIRFMFFELMMPKIEGAAQLGAWMMAPFDYMAGMSAYVDLDTLELPPDALADVRQVVEGRGQVMPVHYVIVPELSFLGSTYFSFVADPHEWRQGGDTLFTFTEGGWETALPVMETVESGCGVLVAPLVASRNSVSVGDTFEVTGAEGPVECTIAGIGAPFVSASIIGTAAGESFGITEPLMAVAWPLPGVDRDVLGGDITAVLDRYPGMGFNDLEDMTELQTQVMNRLPNMLNALLLLAIVSAALGVVNTTVMSVAERRCELGLLRAVGATRRQVMAVVTGEATLMGLIGGGLGLVAGAGVVVILAVTYGGSAWGILDLDLWGAAYRSVQPALFNGLVGLITAPLICAGAAWLPVRSLLRGPAIGTMAAIETMQPERQPETTRRAVRRRAIMRLLSFLALRNLEQHRLRTILSALAVALGAAMIVAASVTSEGVRSGIQASDASQDAAAWLTDSLEISLSAVGVVILIAAGFLIFNAFAMAITQRRRQIGALRSLGMTRRQVMRLVLVEALIIGGLGTLLGLVVGPLFGNGILTVMRYAGVEIGEGSVSFVSIVLAVVMGVGMTLLSVLIPARRATRISPLVALREETQFLKKPGFFQKTWFLGLLIMASLTVYIIIAPPGEWAMPPWNLRIVALLLMLWMAAALMILPALAGIFGQVTRRPLTRLWGATGRLIADNLGRGRRRVTLTILTFVVGLTMIVSVTGIFLFTNKVLFIYFAEGTLQQTGWDIYSFDYTLGVGVIQELNLETIGLKQEVIEDVYQVTAGRAEVGENYTVVAPEIGAFTPNFPSAIIDPRILARPGACTLVEGDWDTALPIMESGCGLLLPPGVATRNHVGIGDRLTLQGQNNPIDCTVAGIGSGGLVPMSYISPAAKDAFGVETPTSLSVMPLPGVDRDELKADLLALAERHGSDAWVIEPEDALNGLLEGADLLISLCNGLLLLVILAAALGVVNTTVMSVAERRRELGLLRAVGATRRQVGGVVIGEAALMGLIGGVLGLVAGAGISVIFDVSFGGNTYGIPDLPLWDATWQAVQPALLTGLLGVIIAPLISAGAAWLPVRSILRGSTIETMEAERQQAATPRQAVVGFLSRGSIRTRFVLGTVTLMTVVLAGLIAVVTAHARTRIEEQMHDALRTMVTWNAGMIELGLPDDAETLDFDVLQTEQMIDFDADTLLRFERLVDDLTEQGLDDFTIADRDNVVLIGLDMRDIGTLAPELETRDKADVYSEREGDEWLMHTTAPIYNNDGLLVGAWSWGKALVADQADGCDGAHPGIDGDSARTGHHSH